ncbi:MAG: prolipoprotein diacylglyceryl transferase, partial [Clostridiales bacterium]|nr:prolipoprotein diacylglyceryl transferase [Clostridiales bacterium]
KTIAMYGLMIALGILIGVFIAVQRCKKYNFSKEDVIFASCYAGIGLILGAKILYILTILPVFIDNWNALITDINHLFLLLSGGFVFYGGFLGAIIGFLIYAKQYHLNFINLLDLIAPSIPIIHGFGRIGCFFAGCCYGIPYEGPFHIIFEHSPIAPNGTPLFPVQLLESICNLIAGGLLILYAKPTRRPGKVLGLYTIYYTVFRFTFEFLRGDALRGIFLNLSTSQWISLAILPLGLYLFFGTDLIKVKNYEK